MGWCNTRHMTAREWMLHPWQPRRDGAGQDSSGVGPSGNKAELHIVMQHQTLKSILLIGASLIFVSDLNCDAKIMEKSI